MTDLFKEFYPTPDELIEQIFTDFNINFRNYKYFLEPSAGKGNLVDVIMKKKTENSWQKPDCDIDCIEISEELTGILKSKNLRVIYNDFLSFHTMKRYDLILLNPPFSDGDKHLLKALSLVENGGDVICILNAETIKNPYTNRRKELLIKLKNLNAQFKFYNSAFTTAERTTNVEVVAIYVSVEKQIGDSVFLNDMKKKYYEEAKQHECTDVAFTDSIKNAILQYNIDVEAGIKLIKEYWSLGETFKSSFTSDYPSYIIEMKLSGERSVTINEYVRCIRIKYWNALFENPDFVSQMTEDLRKKYASKVQELADYDFCEYNIREIKIDITKNLVKGLEDTIIKVFDEMTHKYSWYPETENNIHYYNGWATNKAWIINRKVILPMDAFRYSYVGNSKELDYGYDFKRRLMDFEKVLNYLDTKGKDFCVDMDSRLVSAKENGETKKIHLKHFTITVYKKGTCHIEFNNDELLKKLNIYGSQHKGWLPPSYGKKHYKDMTKEEQAVIDEFEGVKNYEETFAKKDYFITDSNSLLQIAKIG